MLIVVDVSGGNILNFRLGDRVKELIPGRWWIELANRYGNKFYVEENGMDNSIQAAIAKIDTCAQRAISSGGKSLCAVVPGVTQDQFYVGVATASVAGAVVGAAARTNGSTFNFPYVLLFSPLWSIFLISFAVAPIATRQESPLSLELVGVLLAFTAIAAAVWAWIPARFGAPGKQPPDV